MYVQEVLCVVFVSCVLSFVVRCAFVLCRIVNIFLFSEEMDLLWCIEMLSHVVSLVTSGFTLRLLHCVYVCQELLCTSRVCVRLWGVWSFWYFTCNSRWPDCLHFFNIDTNQSHLIGSIIIILWNNIILSSFVLKLLLSFVLELTSSFVLTLPSSFVLILLSTFEKKQNLLDFNVIILELIQCQEKIIQANYHCDIATIIFSSLWIFSYWLQNVCMYVCIDSMFIIHRYMLQYQ